MEPQPIETRRLKNGLTLTIHDLSRKVAADRWRVELSARITISVEECWFGPALPAPAGLSDMRAALGEAARIEYRDIRNFVDEREKTVLFEAMRATVYRNAESYYSRPDFPGRFLIRQYSAPLRTRPLTD